MSGLLTSDGQILIYKTWIQQALRWSLSKRDHKNPRFKENKNCHRNIPRRAAEQGPRHRWPRQCEVEFEDPRRCTASWRRTMTSEQEPAMCYEHPSSRPHQTVANNITSPHLRVSPIICSPPQSNTFIFTDCSYRKGYHIGSIHLSIHLFQVFHSIGPFFVAYQNLTGRGC